MRKVLVYILTASILSIALTYNFALVTTVKAGYGTRVQSVFNPAEDTYVSELNPTSNYGTGHKLWLQKKANASKESMMKFNVSGIAANGPGYKVKLRLYYTYQYALPSGETALYAMGNSWSETTVTWETKPSYTTEIAVVGHPSTSGLWVELDVTSYITGDGTWSFYMKTDSSANVNYDSSEGTNKPQLVVTWPIVSDSSPEDGENYIPVNRQNMIINFAESMDQSTLVPANIILTKGETSTPISYTGYSNTADSYTLTFPGTLDYWTEYKVKITTDVKYSTSDPIEQEVVLSFKTIPQANDNLTTTRFTPWLVQLHLTDPEAVAQGIKGGEGAQMIWDLAVAQRNPQHMLLGSDAYTVWKSTDSGSTWRITDENSSIKVQGTVDAAFDPEDSNLVFIAAAVHKNTEYNDNCGIWKSSDGGATWQQVLSVPYWRQRSGDVIQFGGKTGNNRTMYAASHGGGIFKSTDSGESWTSIGLSTNTVVDLFYDNTNARLIAATLDSGVLVSNDDGQTWTPKNSGLSSTGISSVAVNPIDMNNWLAVCGGNAIYKTVDAGDSWTEVSIPDNLRSACVLERLKFGAGGTRLYLTMSNQWYPFRVSTDLGQTWSNEPVLHNETNLNKSVNGWVAEAIEVHPTSADTVWASFSATLYKSTDGGLNFHPTNSGYSGYRAKDFLFDATNSNNTYIGVIDRGLVRSVDPASSDIYPMFTDLADDKTHNIRFDGAKTVNSLVRDPNNSNHLFIAVGEWQTSIISESWDGGETFTYISGTEGSQIEYMAYHPLDANIIYAEDRISTDGGLSWNFLSKKVRAFQYSNTSVVWGWDKVQVGGTEEDPIYTFYVYNSTDRGINWTPVTTFDNDEFVYCMRADLFNSDRLWIGTKKGVCRLDGATKTYYGMDNGILAHNGGLREIFDIAQNPANSDHLLAGGVDLEGRGPTAGLFETYDGGVTWKVVPTVPGRSDIWRIEFHPAVNKAYIGTSAGTFVYEYDKLLFKDDFNDGNVNGWSVSSGTWQINEGNEVTTDTAPCNVFEGDVNWSGSYTIEAKIKVDSWAGTGIAGLFSHYVNGSNYYRLYYEKSSNKLKILKRVAGSTTVLASSSAFALSEGVYHKFRLSINGSSLTAYVDDVQMASASDNSLPAGKIGCYTYDQKAYFDDLKVWK